MLDFAPQLWYHIHGGNYIFYFWKISAFEIAILRLFLRTFEKHLKQRYKEWRLLPPLFKDGRKIPRVMRA